MNFLFLFFSAFKANSFKRRKRFSFKISYFILQSKVKQLLTQFIQIKLIYLFYLNHQNNLIVVPRYFNNNLIINDIQFISSKTKQFIFSAVQLKKMTYLMPSALFIIQNNLGIYFFSKLFHNYGGKLLFILY